jgi:transcriptional regulator with XRE-family HTH domain
LQFAITLDVEHQQYLLSLGRNILMTRKAKSMSQQDVANDCNVDRARIGKIENGKIAVQVTTIVEIAKALKVDVLTLFPSTLNLPQNHKL